ncbi:hypothetical protein CAPTEDRAFT_217322 [Capitella teleta]|uniref:LRRCT domain-containing protein n=1 Tax=Capitella teleta TaxID=283909 RepID=R7TZN5_CAPTE|nr:hypothetical protein CAPTEDRAFT_217322 [Capitella teleta]|eukprot:ELT99097.1 hypothetical protein CAPTEDRAFT_217322 [Capitella teleta]
MHLNNNELTTVPNLKGLTVTILSLNTNEIQLNRDSFENVSIVILRVDENKITDLSPVTRLSDSLLSLSATSNPLGNSSAADLYHLIESLRTLRDLNLASCGLSTIPDFQIFKESTNNFNLRVKENPFECDARLAWLRNSSMDIADYESIVCATPPEHKGQLLHTIPLQDLCPDAGDCSGMGVEPTSGPPCSVINDSEMTCKTPKLRLPPPNELGSFNAEYHHFGFLFNGYEEYQERDDQRNTTTTLTIEVAIVELPSIAKHRPRIWMSGSTESTFCRCASRQHQWTCRLLELRRSSSNRHMA